MSDQVAIIEAMVRTIRASGLERGLLWIPLSERVRAETKCTHEEFDEAVLTAMDQDIVEEREIGWIRVKGAP